MSARDRNARIGAVFAGLRRWVDTLVDPSVTWANGEGDRSEAQRLRVIDGMRKYRRCVLTIDPRSWGNYPAAGSIPAPREAR